MAEKKLEKINFLYLSNEDVFTAGLSMAEAIQQCNLSLEEYAAGHVENPPKPGIHPTSESFIHAMPCKFPLPHLTPTNFFFSSSICERPASWWHEVGVWVPRKCAQENSNYCRTYCHE